MASKAYVASMTVVELTSELKKRGLSCRGKKKALQNRLEEALEDEEMSESSSDDGREATMRAASAVISQLEGDGETRGNNNLIVTATPPQEQLVVSIEHSRRQLRLREPNGNDAKLASEDMSMTLKAAGIESNSNDIGIEKHPVIPTQEPTKSPVIPAPMVPSIEREPSPVTKEQLHVIEPVVELKEDSKLGNEEGERVSSGNHDDTVEHPIIEPQQQLVQSPPTQQQLVQSPPTQQQQLPTQLLIDSASHTLESLHGGVSTPDKRNQLQVPPETIVSPMHQEAESEVNSIAVEPPSPRDISFAIEDGNTSVSESVELMDVATPSVVGGVTMDTVTMTTGDDKAGGDNLITECQNDDVVGAATNEVTTATNVNEGVVDSQRPQEVREEGVSSKTSSVGSGGGVDVLVSTVDEDISVFPGDVPAGGNIASDKALQRPDSILTSCENKRSFSASESAVPQGVGGGLVSDTCPGEGEGSETGSKGVGPEERERTGVPSSKRRKMSGSPKRIERRRRWGSNSARTPTQTHTAISSDILEDIIPDEVKEEMVAMDTTGTSNLTALEAVMNYGVEEEGEGGKEPLTTTGRSEEEREDEVKPPVEEEDILDLGKESSMMDEYEQEWKEKERERDEQRRESTKAKQELETRRRIEARVRARQQEADVKDKPPLVQRTPSPARRPPSRILHIENLTRPFTNTQLRDLLQEGDNPLVEGGCWTDRIKSHCIAIYVSMESAIEGRNRIHNLKWPRQNPRLLKADYLTHEEVRDYSNGELEVQPEGRGEEGEAPERPVELQKKRESPPATINEPAKVNVERRRSTRLSSSDGKENVTIEEKPKSMLDKLFRKTKATPPIYWLPLSEKEANDKELERKAIEEEREKRREERHKEREEMIREREEQRKERGKSRSPPRGRGRSPRYRRRSSSSPGRRSRSPRRRTPIRKVRSPRRSRSPVRR